MQALRICRGRAVLLTPLWQQLQPAPAEYCKALLQDLDPWTGAYSFVYPVGDHQVLKLVREPGAIEYLQMCHRGDLSSENFPKVLTVTPDAFKRVETGEVFTAVLMERLTDGGTRMERYSQHYVQRVRMLEDEFEDIVSLSREAGSSLCSMLHSVGIKPLASSLLALVQELEPRQWVLDLGNPDNWMLRRGANNERIVVLSDPVHLACNFAAEL